MEQEKGWLLWVKQCCHEKDRGWGRKESEKAFQPEQHCLRVGVGSEPGIGYGVNGQGCIRFLAHNIEIPLLDAL